MNNNSTANFSQWSRRGEMETRWSIAATSPNSDAGGADIVITYTPRANDRFMDVNFIQAVIDRTSGGNSSRPVLDGASISRITTRSGHRGNRHVTRASPESPPGPVSLMSSACQLPPGWWMPSYAGLRKTELNRRALDPLHRRNHDESVPQRKPSSLRRSSNLTPTSAASTTGSSTAAFDGDTTGTAVRTSR